MEELFSKLTIHDIHSNVSNSNKKIMIKNKMEWINWTDKSNDVLFKSTIKGVGDGEQKVAIELDTIILGQNSDYDMTILIHDITYKCDVKKLDHNTFNTGVKGRNALRPIKDKITELLYSFKKIVRSTLLNEEDIKDLIHFDSVSPDELCVSNIQKLNQVLYALHEKRKNMISTLPIVSPFINKDGSTFTMNLFEYYNICLILNINIPDEFKDLKQILDLLKYMEHEYIINPSQFMNELNDLVSIFNELKLIFVDEKHGYYIVDDITKIKFERITRGHPRFRFID